MPILLCAATSFEIAPTLEILNSGHTSKEPIEILITGVGLTAALYQLTKKLSTSKPSLVIQAGIGGCFDTTIALGEAVVIKNESIGDSGVMENGTFKTLFDMNFIKENEKPWSNKKLTNPYDELLKACRLQIVDSVTVNEISSNWQRIKFYKNYFNATIESLEGAALHYAAIMEEVPFLQLRSASNYIGERDKAKWKFKESIENLNVALQHILINL